MLPKYQLMFVHFYKIFIGNIKKMANNVFDKERYVLFNENLQLYLRLVLSLKKMYIRILSILLSKTICLIPNTKNNRSRKQWRQQ